MKCLYCNSEIQNSSVHYCFKCNVPLHGSCLSKEKTCPAKCLLQPFLQNQNPDFIKLKPTTPTQFVFEKKGVHYQRFFSEEEDCSFSRINFSSVDGIEQDTFSLSQVDWEAGYWNQLHVIKKSDKEVADFSYQGNQSLEPKTFLGFYVGHLTDSEDRDRNCHQMILQNKWKIDASSIGNET